MSRRTIIIFFACTLLLAAACSDNRGTSNGVPTGTTPNGTISVSGDHISATISIASGAAAVGGTAGVQIAAARLVPPGLGAWTLVLSYDPAVVSILKCDTGNTFAACNPKAQPGVLRLAGATAKGLLDSVSLATITFKCDHAGTSDLTLSADTLADATIGSPRNIAPTFNNGTITCR